MKEAKRFESEPIVPFWANDQIDASPAPSSVFKGDES